MLETNWIDWLTTPPPWFQSTKQNHRLTNTFTTRFNYPIRQQAVLDNAPLKMQSKIIFHAGRIQYQKIRTPTPPPKDTVSYFKLHAHLCDVPTFLNNKFHDLLIASGKLCPSLHLLRITQCRTRRSSVVSREGVCAADWRCQQLCIERTMLCSLELSAVMPRTVSRRRKISHQISDHEGRSVVAPWKRTVLSRLVWSAAMTWKSGPFSWFFKLLHEHCKNMRHPTCHVYSRANNCL